jgi:protein TonB
MKEPWKGSFNSRDERRRAKPSGIHAASWGAAVAISLHALVALALMLVPPRGLHDHSVTPVEVDVLPPPLPAPPPPEPPPSSDPTPRPVVRKQVVSTKPHPPMPNQEVKPAPPTDESATPVFGVTQDSVVAGDSPVAVPVGNTLMTKDRTLAKVPVPPLPPAPPPPAFAPVDEESVAEFPEAYVKPEPEYPEIARRMGIGGKVLVRIGIDRKGNVKSVRVLEKVGYGMDEAAVKAAWQSKWKPARRADGQPVDMVITYSCVFKSAAQ